MALEAELSPAEQESIERAPTNSAAAYALYLNALDADFDGAQSYLDRAIEIDPSFALAYATKARIIGGGYVGEVARPPAYLNCGGRCRGTRATCPLERGTGARIESRSRSCLFGTWSDAYAPLA